MTTQKQPETRTHKLLGNAFFIVLLVVALIGLGFAFYIGFGAGFQTWHLTLDKTAASVNAFAALHA